MFFFLSKTLNYLAAPLVIVCVLLLLSSFLRSLWWKRWLFRTGLFLLLFWSNDFIVNEVMLRWEVPPKPFNQITKRYTWGIVLTGVTHSDYGPNDRTYFLRGADRVTHTVQLYKLGVIKKILVSGGNSHIIDDGTREADEIASVLKVMGVSPQDILVENSSRNTHESAVEVRRLMLGKTTPANCLLITSGYHLRRSLACYAKVGWTMDIFSTDFLAHPRKFSFDSLFIPGIDALGKWQTLIKEWIGCLAYKIAGYI
jgi:uncharacterized SAM-binding protein YcdF (DUF218 family)